MMALSEAGEAFKALAMVEEKRFITLEQNRPTFKAPDKARDSTKVDTKFALILSNMSMGCFPWPLFVHGGAGSGKTCAAMVMIDAFGGWYTTIEEMTERINKANAGTLMTSSGYPWSTTEIHDSWGRANLVVIDELGERGEVTTAHYTTTKKLIDLRERNGIKPALYISNRTVADIARIYGDPVASRIASGTVVRIDGDRRLGQPVTVACNQEVPNYAAQQKEKH